MVKGSKSKARKISGLVFLLILVGMLVVSCGYIPQNHTQPWNAAEDVAPLVEQAPPEQEAVSPEPEVLNETEPEIEGSISTEPIQETPQPPPIPPQPPVKNDVFDKELALPESVADDEYFEPCPPDAKDCLKFKIPRTDSKNVSLAKLRYARIDKYVQDATKRYRTYFTLCLKRFDTVRPTMEAIFDQHGLPRDLVYVAFVESGGKATATSRKGAVGYWQFLPETARDFGLRVDKWVDERRDLEKSTHAAAKYLKYLYGRFNDWPLACAAYNCGQGAISRVMRRNAHVDSFWDISYRMFRRNETLQFVPKILATIKVCKNREQYGFEPAEDLPLLSYDIVMVKPYTPLANVAKVTGISLTDLSQLNTSLVRHCAPPDVVEFGIKVPKGTGAQIAVALFNSDESQDFSTSRPVQDEKPVSNRIKKYQTTHDVLPELDEFDGYQKIKRSRVGLGPVNSQGVSTGDASSKQKLSRMNKVKANEPAETEPDPSGEDIEHKFAGKQKDALAQGADTKLITYHVKKGDTIWDIARLYNISSDDIKRENPNTKLIRPGDKLIIALKSPAPQKQTQVQNEDDGLITYRVKQGDTIWDIARLYNVSPEDIKRSNRTMKMIRPGDKLIIARNSAAKQKQAHPPQITSSDLVTHHVKKGDTIWDIARLYNVSPEDIMRWNRKMELIRPGDKLVIYTKS